MTVPAAIMVGDNVSAPAARERPGADTTEVPVMQRQRTTPEQRFWPKVDKNGPVPEHRPDLGPCWIWTASTAGVGYGQFWAGPGKSDKAHRFAYELLVGPIPEGLVPDHLCRVRACVNPAHLEPVTPRENTLRGESFAAHFARQTHCAQGHELTPENTRPERGWPHSRRSSGWKPSYGKHGKRSPSSSVAPAPWSATRRSCSSRSRYHWPS